MNHVWHVGSGGMALAAEIGGRLMIFFARDLWWL